VLLDDQPSDWWQPSGPMTRYPDGCQCDCDVSPERIAADTAVAAAAAAARGRITELN